MSLLPFNGIDSKVICKNSNVVTVSNLANLVTDKANLVTDEANFVNNLKPRCCDVLCMFVFVHLTI